MDAAWTDALNLVATAHPDAFARPSLSSHSFITFVAARTTVRFRVLLAESEPLDRVGVIGLVSIFSCCRMAFAQKYSPYPLVPCTYSLPGLVLFSAVFQMPLVTRRPSSLCTASSSTSLSSTTSTPSEAVATVDHPHRQHKQQRRQPVARYDSLPTIMAVKFSQSSYAKCTITPPHLNRQHSYGMRQQDGGRDATAVLAKVASRTASPGRKSPTMSPFPSPSVMPTAERRTSWEDCKLKHDGYISFPDFDELRAQHEPKSTT